MKKNWITNNNLIRLLVVLLISALFLSLALFVSQISNKQLATTSVVNLNLTSPIDTSEWPTYTNTAFGYSFKYHPDRPPRELAEDSLPVDKAVAVSIISPYFHITVDRQQFYRNQFVYNGRAKTLQTYMDLVRQQSHSLDDNIHNGNNNLERVRLASGHKGYGFVTEKVVRGESLFTYNPGQQPTRVIVVEKEGVALTVQYRLNDPISEATITTLQLINDITPTTETMPLTTWLLWESKIRE